MGYPDLRGYLERLEAAGKLHRVTAEVDKDWEISAVTRVAFQTIPEPQRPGILFERVRGYDVPVVVGVLGASRSVYAMALDTDVDHIPDVWAEAQVKPIPPRVVADGPCHEVVAEGDAADMGAFPVPVWTVGHDPGPYLTAPCVITVDPATGQRNVGTYRCQVKGPRKLGLWINFVQHGRFHVEANDRLGKPTPVAIVLGADPSVGLVSVSRVSAALDELAVAGGLRHEPLDVVPCRTVPLEVPATSEIVIEGWIRPGELESEGPFGEYTGYMGPVADSNVVDITCITHRRKPIFHAFLSQMPPSESSCIRGTGREMGIYRNLTRDLGLPVVDVHLLESGGGAALTAISIRKQYAAQPRQVMLAAWGVDPTMGKVTVVVDDDIDVRDPFQLNWAIAYRFQPQNDLVLIPHMSAVRLDPSQAAEDVPQLDPSRRESAKMGLDATMKHRFPPRSIPPAEHLQRVRQDWVRYGFGDLLGPAAR